MLVSLSIRDVLLIDRLELPLKPGHCVLTGETGAGKSILLNASGLALGARSESDLIRKGAERGSGSAFFVLPRDHPACALLDALSGSGGREEIARMLAGARITEEARVAAEKLIHGAGP